MDYLENKKHTFFLSKSFLFYFRYEDDILVCFTSTEGKFDELLKHMNSLHQNIGFTIEIENAILINFLDLHTQKIDSKLDFFVYNQLILNNSGQGTKPRNRNKEKSETGMCYVSPALQ